MARRRTALTRKYPDGRIRAPRAAGDTDKIARGSSIRPERRRATAFSTCVHVVFWVRIAPTITSKGESAGHQCWGP